MANPIINRFKHERPADETAEEQHFSFTAELPAGEGAPLWRMHVDVVERPEGEGSRLRMRVRMRTAVGEALTRASERAHARAQLRGSSAQAALGAAAAQPPDPNDAKDSGHSHDPRRGALSPAAPAGGALARVGQRIGQRIGQQVGGALTALVDRGLRQPLVQKWIEPLKQNDINTWFEIQASSAPLDAGADALLPEPERLAQLGIRLRPQAPQVDAPVMESWATPAGDDQHFALVSVIRMAKEHLPPAVQALLGDQPFHLAGTMVNLVEPHQLQAASDASNSTPDPTPDPTTNPTVDP